MQNILSIDVEDWFHILDLEGAPDMREWTTLENRVERNFNALLDELERGGGRTTCFFLGWVAERYPQLVRRAHAAGHEVASHGYGHQLVYSMPREAFTADIRKAKAILEGITGAPVLGYRAPGFSIVAGMPWAFEEIASAGYRYDASIFPARRGHGGIADAPARPHRISTGAGELQEFPVSVAEVLGRRLCFFGGGYLRISPYFLIRRMAARLNEAGLPVIYYLHPREIDPEQPRMRMNPARRFKSYVNLGTTLPKLRRLLGEQTLVPFRDWMARQPAPA